MTTSTPPWTTTPDYSRAAYAEILPDEKGTTCAGFWLRAAAWFADHGVIVR